MRARPCLGCRSRRADDHDAGPGPDPVGLLGPVTGGLGAYPGTSGAAGAPATCGPATSTPDRIARRARARYSGPCLRGSAYSFGFTDPVCAHAPRTRVDRPAPAQGREGMSSCQVDPDACATLGRSATTSGSCGGTRKRGQGRGPWRGTPVTGRGSPARGRDLGWARVRALGWSRVGDPRSARVRSPVSLPADRPSTSPPRCLRPKPADPGAIGMPLLSLSGGSGPHPTASHPRPEIRRPSSSRRSRASPGPPRRPRPGRSRHPRHDDPPPVEDREPPVVRDPAGRGTSRPGAASRACPGAVRGPARACG